MIHPRYRHTATLLTSGLVLVVGTDGGGNAGVATAELYDRGSGTWSPTASAAGSWYDHVAALLGDGRVLIAAGYQSSSRIYDPVTAMWSSAGKTQQRIDPIVAVLKDGRVLVAGGGVIDVGATATAEIFDPVAGAWQATSDMTTPRQWHAASRLDDGRVLVVGGENSIKPYLQLSAEIYDPVAGLWTPTGSMLAPRYLHAAVTLGSGKVLVAGGSPQMKTAELYDPVAGIWTPTAMMSAGRSQFGAVLLGVGKVLVAGGVAGLNSAELYDPLADTWTPTGSMSQGRGEFTANVLKTGEVLAAGGRVSTPSFNAFSSTELFGLVQGNGTCMVDGECVGGLCADGFCCNQACDAPCFACSAAKKGHGKDGICEAVAAGIDADGDCIDDGSPSCQQNGLCDGKGACQYYPKSDGCTPVPCADGAQCKSGFCVDGVCCENACAGGCEACTAALKANGPDGLCGPVAADTDPDDDCAEDEKYPGSCKADGLCDGTGNCREHAKADTGCGPADCDGVELAAALCDGAGTCVQKTLSCAPFDCQGGACTKSCSDDRDCASGAWCDQGECAFWLDNGEACSGDAQCQSATCTDGVCCTKPDCAPYRCGPEGTCLQVCASTLDCAAGHVCTSARQCVPAGGAAPGEDGCGCRAAGRGESGRFWLLAGLVAAAATRRRRGRALAGALLALTLLLALPLGAQPTPPAGGAAEPGGAEPAGKREPPPDPQLAEAKRLFFSGNELRLAGDYQRALEYYLESRALMPSVANTKNAAICLDELGRYDEALELYEELITRFREEISDEDRAAVAPDVQRLRGQVGSIDAHAVTSAASSTAAWTRSLSSARRSSFLPASHFLRISSLPGELLVAAGSARPRSAATCSASRAALHLGALPAPGARCYPGLDGARSHSLARDVLRAAPGAASSRLRGAGRGAPVARAAAGRLPAAAPAARRDGRGCPRRTRAVAAHPARRAGRAQDPLVAAATGRPQHSARLRRAVCGHGARPPGRAVQPVAGARRARRDANAERGAGVPRRQAGRLRARLRAACRAGVPGLCHASGRGVGGGPG
ncbi:MAG: hypothetical protein HY744_13900 [Deltaproteobacteria bacterium]|nr:hypothetical protein [Deltaproteobacteria bacterium]